MLLRRPKNIATIFSLELVIVAFSILLASMVTLHVYRLGMVRALVDQNSHLNLTRQVIDSLTPGLSQIGFWPPLLHIIMIPFVAIDPLYRSGLAGFFTLTPFLAVAAVFLYKISLLLTKNKWISLAGSVLFLLNPYVLYYTATPMMEILFIANLFATAYFLTKWFQTNWSVPCKLDVLSEGC